MLFSRIAFAAALIGLAVAINGTTLAQSGSAGNPGQACQNDANSANYSAAIGDCTQAIGLNASDPIAYGNRCLAYDKLGNYGAAVIDCSQAIALDPKFEAAYIHRCSAYLDQTNFTAAVADCTEALALNANDELGYSFRCAAYNGEQNYSTAITDCTKALSLNSKDATAYFNRGIAYERTNNNVEAINDFRQALVFDPSNQLAQQELIKLGANNSPNVPSQAQMFTLQVCNQTTYYAYVAVAHLTTPGGGSAWEDEGWWQVNPNSCASMGPFPAGTFYTYGDGASTAHGEPSVYWSGTDTSLCIEQAVPFTIADSGQQCATNQSLVGFKQWTVPAGSSTFTINWN